MRTCFFLSVDESVRVYVYIWIIVVDVLYIII